MGRARLHKTRAFRMHVQPGDFAGAGSASPQVGVQVIDVAVNVTDLGILIRAVT